MQEQADIDGRHGLGWPVPEGSHPDTDPKFSTGLGWAAERGNPQDEVSCPQEAGLADAVVQGPTPDAHVSPETPAALTESETAAPDNPGVTVSRETPASPVRTAGELADRTGGFGDDSTPMARAVQHQLMVREGRRFGEPLPRPARPRVLVVANQKGGVGKTTTTVNLAVALAQHGLRVLVIDLDPQGNASTALSVDHQRGTPSSYDVLVDGTPVEQVVRQHADIPGLQVVPATIDLAGAEIELVSVVARESRLRRAIAAYPPATEQGADRLDYVLVDCPPSLGLLTLNALVAGEEMLIPIQAEYYALEGLGQLVETVEMVRTHLNQELRISTILITMYDSRTKLAAGVAQEVREHFHDTVLRTTIPRSVRVSEAPSYGQSVMTYDPGSPGALSYLEAARELALRADGATGAGADRQNGADA